jgi:hypothetical protein
LNPDPDPQPCYKEQFRFIGRLAEKEVFDSVSLKGQCQEIIFSGFFHLSSFPKPLKITSGSGSFGFFSKLRGDIRKSRCTPGGKFAAGVNFELRISLRIFEKVGYLGA